MDGVQLPHGYSHFKEAVYVLPFSSQNFLVQELYILLTPDQEHKVFQDVLVVGYHNCKSLKDHLVRVKLPNVEITGRSESYGKRSCQVFDFICDTVFLSKPVVKHSEFKVGNSTVTLRRSFTS